MPLSFDQAVWAELASTIENAFCLDAAASSRLEGNNTARLVAALPYLADCEEPRRTALAHLGIFVLANTKAARGDFDHKPADDANPLHRLAPIADFQGGDSRVIERGMKLLALVMLNGYERDISKDAAAGEYNPVGAKTWDASALRTRFTAELRAAACPQMDAVMTLESALRVFWDE